MAYLSLYRKYRSQTFGDLVGQDHVVKTLQNAISSGRIAHSYLFTGPRGTGKTSSARLLAKALNAENGPTPNPSDDDPICKLIAEGNCVDVVELDAASEAGVENIREAIVDVVEYRPMMARYKIFIIDEVHDLSGKAFDALLKTIEEPPPHIIFILATTEYNKVPPTIRSRCQKFEFHRGSIQDLVTRLSYVAKQEGVTIEPAAVTAIARMADGGFRDALTLLEQAIVTSDGSISVAHVYDQLGLISEELVDGLLQAMREADVPKIIETLNEVARMGRDPRAVLESMLHRLGDLTRVAYGVDIGGSGDTTQEAMLHETAARIGRDVLLNFRSSLSEAHKVIRDISLPRLWLESEIIRIATDRKAPTLAGQGQSAPKQAVVVPVAAPKELNSTETNGQRRDEPRQTESQASPVVESQAPTGNPDFDRVLVAWQEIFADLSKLSKTMSARLLEAKIGSVEGKRVYLEFSRQIDHLWVAEVPKRQSAVVDAFKQKLGEDWEVELGVGKAKAAPAEPQAVELALEGQKLADTVREIFGAN
ncbi:MAG: DNA polymerase III, subunit gamma and tau [Armatimonadetes bacterium 55-13]|nr:DNA polymerase III subunit gamma/tau [Armatimonadota bacterium]OJU61502.1 MAG: DNA polymerase III, subunit gamma and tau [Armatimonadetes bacterium 55-13]